MNDNIDRKRLKSIDTIWTENLEKLEGKAGLSALPCDHPALFHKLIKALKDRGSLPCDMDNPETMTEVEAVNEYANALYDAAAEIMGTAEDMMVGEQVEKAYNDIQEELRETMSDRDKMIEAGHNAGDF